MFVSLVQAGRVKLGLWGGNGGNPQDINGNPTRVSKIVVRSGQAIDSLAYAYDQDGKTFEAGPWGGSGGNPTTVRLLEISIVRHGLIE